MQVTRRNPSLENPTAISKLPTQDYRIINRERQYNAERTNKI